MTEPSSAEAEAPIEDGDEKLEVDTDNSEAPVFGPDTLHAFIPHDGEAWPDLRSDGGNFEDDAFLPEPQPDEGAK